MAPATASTKTRLRRDSASVAAPVREACRSLQRDGLLDIVPNQGAFVRVLTLAEIVNLFDVRACLGRLAGELAAAAMTRSAMAQLRDLMTRDG